jgi:hypothetical protein
MAAQLERPNRVVRAQINRINERFAGDRRKISDVYKGINFKNIDKNTGDVAHFLKNINNVLGENFKKRDQPSFPFAIMSLALLKDGLDYAQLTIIGMLITIPMSIVISIVLIYWAWGKTSCRAWKEKILRWLFISIIIELFPYLNFIPATVILVIIIHYNETKIIRLANVTIDYLNITIKWRNRN